MTAAASSWQILEMAADVNDSRQIVGWGTTGAGAKRAFRFDLATNEVTDLGTIATQDPSYQYQARKINAKGHVVGGMTSSGTGQRAFIWTAEWGMMDINGFVSLKPGWVLRDAFGINDRDEVVGWAWNSQIGLKLFRVRIELPGGVEFYEPTDGQVCSLVKAINNKGDVAGWSDACDPPFPGSNQVY